jgi:hypothetical protein
MHSKPITAENRDKIIAHIAAGLLGAYQDFRERRQIGLGSYTSEHPRTAPKVGRNEMCPCGSGKMRKRCCGGAGMN